ncbi:MAG TPA: TatD family hydrolase [Candidatus Paceibacterota bacterium]|nr:TatD family hydrolase [Candidatus Paceibacterota bacterium]
MNFPEYFDIHSHINDAAFDGDRVETIRRMAEAGVATLVVGTDEKMSQDAVAIASQNENIWAVVGLHPTDTDEGFRAEVYRDLLHHSKTVGVGECGLDYYRMKEDTEAERKRQKNVFEAQLELAVETGKPLMIHCRDAHEDMLSILESKKKSYGEKLWGNIHFFTASPEAASRYFNLEFTISFTGVLTFTHDYDEVVRFAPLSMIQSETDSPYVSPVPYRGSRNEPTHVREVVKKIAEIRGEDLEKVRHSLLENTVRVFRLG